MMTNHETNLDSKQSSTFMGTLQDKLKDIKNFSNWPAKEQMVAVTAVGVIFGALLPVVAVALPVAAAGAAVALTLFFAVKAVEYGYKGLKWSAEKTWEGAKRVGGKIRDGAVYVKDSVKKGYEHSVDSLKRGASFVGEGAANKFHKASGKENYLDKIKRFTPEEIKKSDEIRNDLKAIFADKENNSGLVKGILSGILSKIDLKITKEADKAKSDQIDHQTFERLLKQGKFISNLNEKSLHSLLTERSLPKDSYFIDSVFSEHHSEIKEVIEECKIEHKLSNSPSLSRSSSTSSLNSNSTDGSTAGLVNPEEHKKAPTFKNKMSSLFRRNKAPKEAKEATEVKYQPLSGPDAMQSAKMGNSIFYVAPQKPPRSNSPSHVSTDDSTPSKPPKRQSVADWIKANGQQQSLATVDPARLRRNSSSSSLPVLTTVVLPKAPESPTSSRDSGINSPNPSGSSTPTERQSLSMKDVEGGNPQAKLRRTNSPYKSEQPSTHMSEQKHTPVNRRLETLV